VVADARSLASLLKNRYDLAIFEHPDISTSPERPKVWLEIFNQVSMILKPNASVILTSFWLNDHIPATFNLKKAGYRILYNGKNRYPGKCFDKSSTGELLLYDKYILIAKMPG
jgi:hypothetical protein